MQDSSSKDHFSERRLLRAASRVRENWIPIQEDHLREYLRNVSQSPQMPDPESVVDFLKSDPGLYLFAVLRLNEILAERGGSLSGPVSLSLLIQSVGVATLLDILNIEAVQCSRFTLSEGTRCTFDKIQETLLAAAVTENCAAIHALNPDEAFFASTLRQLGMLLIAWNYPGLYEEAILNGTREMSCEDWLAAELGFAPHALALQVCVAGKNADNYSLFEQYLDNTTFAANNEVLFRVCSLGEVLSRGRFPEYYRFDSAELSEAYTQLDIMGGGQLFQDIQSTFETLVSPHTAFIVGDGGSLPRPLSEYWRPRVEVNDETMFNELLPTSLRNSLSAFYVLLRNEVEARRLLHLFMNELVAAADFDAGALFSFDSQSLELVRRAATGNVTAQTPIVCDALASDRNIIRLAFESEQVLFEYNSDEHGLMYTGCAVAFGSNPKLGVLYVQSAEVPADVESEELLRARLLLLRKALEEALLLASF